MNKDRDYKGYGQRAYLEGLLKVWEIGLEIEYLLSKSSIFNAITNKFASCLAVRNETVLKS